MAKGPWGIDDSLSVEEQLEKYRCLEDYFNTVKINSIEHVATACCTFMSTCHHCPVVIYGLDNRTEYEKTTSQVPCQKLLHDWMREEFSKLEDVNSITSNSKWSALENVERELDGADEYCE